MSNVLVKLTKEVTSSEYIIPIPTAHPNLPGRHNYQNPQPNANIPIDTLVFVDHSQLIPEWVEGKLGYKIPVGVLIAYMEGQYIKIAETAQPLQVTGPIMTAQFS